ncbi:MAG: prepilin-type N-terminal cleavage/methylation domain-containing protein [Candidatus Omnitrophica bacterium]|nr:prepilin-type N-terminal cleavage/methylation domain-containing protein [Candidatus Omnitrophota bacterium]
MNTRSTIIIERMRKSVAVRGFTLMETIIAITVLAVGIVAMVSYFPISIDAARRSLDLTRAAFVAQNRMELIKAAAYANITNADGYATGGFVPDADYPAYEYAVTVQQPGGDPNLRDITVAVRWQYKLHTLQEQFQTSIPKYNPG